MVTVVTPAQSSRRFLGQGDKLGTYEVIRQIAVGGMAELYLARTVGTEGFEKLVCVKRIVPQNSNNASFVNMFLNEARLAATLHHPNIAQVYDIGQEQGEFFFAMEYVHGEDLGRLVAAAHDNGVPISLDCALTLGSGLCAGLHHAHERASPEGKPLGVVHRDVSPSNVLVSYDGAVKLVDFGIARASGLPQTSTTGLKGKASYMSPEQCRGKVGLDRRSDVFSIGTILYELTTGRRPFVDDTEYGVLQQIVNRDAERPSAVVPGYPAALEAIVMRALSRDVERRFSTALELQNQLEDFAHDNRLRVSPLVLARLMSTLFPARLEEWDHARAQGAFFVEQHVVRTLIESGKTPEATSRYAPQPLPPATDDFGGAAAEEAPTVPAGRGSDPEIATQVGVAPPTAPPRMSTPPPGAHLRPPRLSTPPPVAQAGPPRMSSPSAAHGTPPRLSTTPSPPGAHLRPPRIATPSPVMPGSPSRMSTPPPMAPGSLTPPPMAPGSPSRMSTPSPMAPGNQPRVATPLPTPPPAGPPLQPRMPTPPPVPGVQPLPGVKYAQMPVPNMPGAVPILTPMLAPRVASAGTLVSSALQAGTAPTTSSPGTPPVNMPPDAAPYVPAAVSDFGTGEPLSNPNMAGYGHGAPGADPHRISGGHPAQTHPAAGGHTASPRRSSNARPTLVLRVRRRSWVPIAAVAGVGVVGALAVLLVVGRGGEPTATPRREPTTRPAANRPSSRAAPAAPEATAGTASAPASQPATEPPTPVGQEPAKVAAPAGQETAAGTGTAPPSPPTAAPLAGGHEPAKLAAPATAPAGSEPAKVVESVPPPTRTPEPSEVEGARKRTAKPTSPDPRKPSRSKIRTDRRADPKRATKPDAKEQQWNDDSPFMPVPTPKR